MPGLELSVVVPVYKCPDCLVQLHERLARVLERLAVAYEIVVDDDRSPDGCWSVLCELHAGDPHVQAVRLSRNFGQHAAITAGLAEARGAWIVVMDCDLQDRPEEIPRLYARANEGYEIVSARRRAGDQPRLRRLANRTNSRLRRLLVNADLGANRTNLGGFFAALASALLAVFLIVSHFLHHSYPAGRALPCSCC